MKQINEQYENLCSKLGDNLYKVKQLNKAIDDLNEKIDKLEEEERSIFEEIDKINYLASKVSTPKSAAPKSSLSPQEEQEILGNL
jgi:prefoldin subunit 5